MGLERMILGAVKLLLEITLVLLLQLLVVAHGLRGVELELKLAKFKIFKRLHI